MSSRPHHGTMVGADHKVCMGCSKTLPLEDYYRNAIGLGGRQSRCKPCFRLQLTAPSNYRQRKAARDAVRVAVKSGRLTKPPSCSACRREADVHGHHDDYAKKLDVRWLCEPCHEDAHRGSTYERHATRYPIPPPAYFVPSDADPVPSDDLDADGMAGLRRVTT